MYFIAVGQYTMVLDVLVSYVHSVQQHRSDKRDLTTVLITSLNILL